MERKVNEMATATTELDTIDVDAELVDEATPLTEKQAKALDKRVRAASAKVTTAAEVLLDRGEALLDLIEEAARGQIHKALGVTWPTWFKDAVQIRPETRLERKALVALMSGKSLSQRTIAGVLNVDQKTISNDLREQQTDEDEAGVTIGLDGKTYSRSKPEVVEEDDEPEDVEYEDIEEEPTAPTPAVELVSEFDDEAANFYNAVSAMTEIIAEPKWSGARRRCAKAHLNNLQEWDTMMKTVIDALMAE
jgi:DNA-binding Lrp family transcriptional regulator